MSIFLDQVTSRLPITAIARRIGMDSIAAIFAMGVMSTLVSSPFVGAPTGERPASSGRSSKSPSSS